MSQYNGKEEYSSDTLERSNVSSLQTDMSSIKQPPEIKNDDDSTKNHQSCFCPQHPFNKINFFPCPILNSKFDQTILPHPCPCQQFLNDHESQNKKIPRKSNLEYPKINENPIKHSFNLKDKNDNAEKIEIYYFDHGNSAYYHTTDIPPILTTEKCAEKTNSAVTRIYAEIFGYIHIATSLLTSFILQFLRCILFSLIRPLIVGVIQLLGDYFIKPLLSITFNGIIQPILILFYNVATSCRDCCEPLATALGFYVKEIATLLKSCRLIEITYNQKSNVTT